MAHINATPFTHEHPVAAFMLIDPPPPTRTPAPFHLHAPAPIDAVSALDRKNFRRFKNNPLISDETKATATATRRRHMNKIYARACKERKMQALLDAHHEITALKDQLREAHTTIERLSRSHTLAQPWPHPHHRSAGPPSPPSPPSPPPSTSTTRPNAAARQTTTPKTHHS